MLYTVIVIDQKTKKIYSLILDSFRGQNWLLKTEVSAGLSCLHHDREILAKIKSQYGALMVENLRGFILKVLRPIMRFMAE